MSEREHVWESRGFGFRRGRDARARDEVEWRATVRAPDDAPPPADGWDDDDEPPSSPSPRLRAVAAIVALSLLVTSAGVCLANVVGGGGWVAVGRADELRARGIVALERPDVFIVWDGDVPVALVRRVPDRTERVEYCRTSRWFEDPLGGSKFDRLGLYRYGPAPRGLDRMGTRIRDGVVEVDPTMIVEGPPRGASVGDVPLGSFCMDVNPDLF